MYQVADSNVLAKGGRALLRRGSSVRISRTVIFLGLTSMLTDISSEMVTAILPLYLMYSLGLSPLQFGVIDGIQGGAASLVRVVSGVAADRFGRYKELAVFGYGL
jgi:nitrate/nitrite transporter NarK